MLINSVWLVTKTVLRHFQWFASFVCMMKIDLSGALCGDVLTQNSVIDIKRMANVVCTECVKRHVQQTPKMPNKNK